MEQYEHLEFLFDNLIQLVEAKNVLAEFLKKEHLENLLYFYEAVTGFSKRLHHEITYLKSVRQITADGSQTDMSSYDSETNIQNRSPSTVLSKSVLKSNSSTTSSPQGNSGFDLYYELELLLQDYLEPNGKYFVAYYDSSRTKLVTAIKERKTKMNSVNTAVEEDELDNALFFGSAFQDFTNSVYTKLKFDLFPRFYRSDLFFKFIKSQPNEQVRLATLNKISKRRDVDSHKIVYTQKEFEEELIREKDFMFTFQLIHDESSFWSPIFHVDEKDESRASAYCAKHGFITDGASEKETIVLKFTGYLPINAEDCVKIVLSGSNMSDSDPSIIISQFVELKEPNVEEESKKEFLERKVASSINHALLTFGPLLSKREVVSSNSLRYFPHLDEYLIVVKPTEHEKFPEKRKPIRARFLSGLSFQSIANNETRFTYVMYAQAGGWLKQIGKYVIRMAKQRSKAYVQSFTKLANAAIQSQKTLDDYLQEPIENTFGSPRILKWNELNVSKEELKRHYKTFGNKNFFDLKQEETKKQVSVRF